MKWIFLVMNLFWLGLAWLNFTFGIPFGSESVIAMVCLGVWAVLDKLDDMS